MRYLIIEDEPLAQEELIRMLKGLDANFELLASIDSVKESIEWLKNNDQPDIIFMDIHLSDNICFDIFNKVEITAPVIFTTAYDQYAIEAFKTNSIAYLLKPIEEEDLIELEEDIMEEEQDQLEEECYLEKELRNLSIKWVIQVMLK